LTTFTADGFSILPLSVPCDSVIEERRNQCDLIEVFKMFYGYTDIDIMVLFTLDGNDKGLRGHSK